MHIRALIPPGIDEITVNGLHQWDYGRTLEIECAECGTEIMEIHFACMGMIVAETRRCNFTNGIGTVTIPDKCLEQSTPITAWIYGLDTDKGRTIKTIRLPIIERTKPIRAHDVPAELVDRYNELAVAAEEAVEALRAGEVKAARATHADEADWANTANHAENASHATTANTAENANYSNTTGAMVMKLVTSCEIVKGKGTIEGNVIKNNTPYFIVFEPTEIGNNYTDYISSGVLVVRKEDGYGSLANFCGCALDTTHGIWFDYNPNASTITVGLTCQSSSSLVYEDASTNGTLYIYTFGDITQ